MQRGVLPPRDGVPYTHISSLEHLEQVSLLVSGLDVVDDLITHLAHQHQQRMGGPESVPAKPSREQAAQGRPPAGVGRAGQWAHSGGKTSHPATSKQMKGNCETSAIQQ